MRRFLSLTLAIILSLSIFSTPALAASDTATLEGTGFHLTISPYVQYKWRGKSYLSTDTSPLINYAAWQTMSGRDKEDVVAHYRGCAVKLGQDFGATGKREMLAWFNQWNGWGDAWEKMRQKISTTNYPDLADFYGPDPQNPTVRTVPYLDRSGLTLTEQELADYDAMGSDYMVIYNAGCEAYLRLITLKERQTATGTSAILKELYAMIVSQATAGRPAGASTFELGLALAMQVKDTNDSLGTSINTYQARQEAYAKLKKTTFNIQQAEEDIIAGTDDAVLIISIFQRMMDRYESNARTCMEACRKLEQQFSTLGASIPTLDAQRKANNEQTQKERDEIGRTAIDHGVDAIDLDPDVSSVKKEDFKKFDHYEDGEPVYVFDEKAYRAKQLEVARDWAGKRTAEDKAAFDGYVSAFEAEHPVELNAWINHYGEIYSGSLFSLSPYSASEYDVCEYGSELFRELGALLTASGEESIVIDGDGNCFITLEDIQAGGILSPENLLWERPNYREYVTAIEAGFTQVIANMERLEALYKEKCVDAAEKRLNAMSSLSAETMDVRSDLFSLTFSHCIYGGTSEDGGYGNWGVSDYEFEAADTKLQTMSEEAATLFNNAWLKYYKIQDDVAIIKEIYRDYEERAAQLESSLPALYALLAETQDDIDTGLYLVRTAWDGLTTMQENYPDWLVGGNELINWAGDDYDNGRLGYGLYYNTEIGKRFFTDRDAAGWPVFKDEAGQRRGAQYVLNIIRDYPEKESEYLTQIANGYAMYTRAIATRQAAGVDEYSCFPGDAELHISGDNLMRNLNSMQLGSVSLQSAWVMLRDQEFISSELSAEGDVIYLDYGYAQYAASNMMTRGLNLLVQEMEGNGWAMKRYQDYYEYLLSIRGDLMRAAAAGKIDQSMIYCMRDIAYQDPERSEYYHGYTGSDGNWHNWMDLFTGNVAAFMPYDAAMSYSFVPAYCFDYYRTTIAPLIDRIEAANASNYTPVTGISKTGTVALAKAVYASAGPGSHALLAAAEPDLKLNVGGSQQLHAAVEPANATFREIVWSTSDDSVATVDESGRVTAVGLGGATITATAQDSPSASPISLTYSVRVSAGAYDSEEEIYAAMGSDAWALVGTELAASGGKAVCSGTLTYNGDVFYMPQMICAIYQGGRFLGMSAAECSLMPESFCSFRAEASLPAGGTGDLTAKLFLLEADSFTPISEYTPLTIPAQ